MGYGQTYNSLEAKDTCIGAPPSSCIAYQGKVLKTLPKEAVECRPSIDDIIDGLDAELFKIKESVNLQQITAQGMLGVPISLYDLQNLKVYQLFNLILADNKRLRDKLTLQTSTSLMDTAIEIDLSCLNNPACTNRTSYKLGEVLQILVAQACS